MVDDLLFEVRILLAKEMEDLIATFLMEQGIAGVVFDEGKEMIGESEGLPAGKAELIFYHRSAEEVKRLCSVIEEYWKEIIGFFPGVAQEVPQFSTCKIDNSWQENWKQFFKPKSVGKRFIIAPPWEEVAAEKDKLVLTINPGLAFGTGQHPTTMLCIELLEEIIPLIDAQGKSKIHLLDVGCGSGILSIAAATLDRSVDCTGIDIDKNALISARENIERNQLTDFILISEKNLIELKNSYDIIVANIQSHILRDLCPDLLARLATDGWLILSGIIDEHENEVKDCYQEETVVFKKSIELASWKALVFQNDR